MEGEYLLVKASGMEALSQKLDALSEKLDAISHRLDTHELTLEKLKEEHMETVKIASSIEPKANKSKANKESLVTQKDPVATRNRFRSVVSSRPIHSPPATEMPRHFKAVRQKKKEPPTYHQMSESMSVAPSEETPEDDGVNDEFVVRKAE